MTTEPGAPDLILHSGLFTTLDRSNPIASAVAVKNGVFTAVRRTEEIMPLAGPATRSVDLRGRRVLPGLIDNHLHIIRGGLNYNMELRWDGVRSLADAMAMLKRQVAVTPPPQWVRVVGGFTEHQFAEKRLPTIEELNAAAPDTPVFLLHLYDRAFLNAAALRAVGYTKDTPELPGGEIVRDSQGNPIGLLVAKPNALILYTTLALGPKLPLDYQVNSTRHFMRELNRLGLTGAIDAGGGYFSSFEEVKVPPAMPDWSPVRTFGGYGAWADPKATGGSASAHKFAMNCGCANACSVHGHDHATAWSSRLPIADLKSFWGALGCACWAV